MPKVRPLFVFIALFGATLGSSPARACNDSLLPHSPDGRDDRHGGRFGEGSGSSDAWDVDHRGEVNASGHGNFSPDSERELGGGQNGSGRVDSSEHGGI